MIVMAAAEMHHIRVSEDTWQQLNSKKKPGDSFEDVVTRLLEDE